MPQYQCPRCGYKCNQRNDLRKHFNRKKICHHIIEDLSIEECFSRSLGEKPSPNKNKILNASDLHPKLRKNGEKCILYASDMHPGKKSCSGAESSKPIITCEFWSNFYKASKLLST